MTVTTTEIRQTVVNEAIERAASERSFLFVYEYKGKLFDQMIWATLIEGEQPPEDARLLCTVNQEGHVDWKIDDLVRTPIARATLPRLSEITLPIEEVQFNNVTIAHTDCRYCDKPIGYDRRFYNDEGYVHASCSEDAIEQERPNRTSTK